MKTKKILIVSVNAIGDTLLSASAIKPLKSKFQSSKVIFVINSESKILEPILEWDEKFVLSSKTIFQFIRIVFKLRKLKIDYAFNFFPGRLNSLLLLLAKSNVKAGFINVKREIKWYNKSQKVYVKGKLKQKQEWISSQSFLERIAIVFKSVGLEIMPLKDYFVKNKNKKIISGEYILLHPFSMMNNKSLSLDQIQELIKLFKEKICDRIVVLGGSELLNRSQFYSYALEQNLILKMNKEIQTVFNLIRNSKLFIAVDSFPIHIADSLNSNFIGLFGPTNPQSALVNYNKSVSFDVENLQDVPATTIAYICRKYMYKNKIIL